MFILSLKVWKIDVINSVKDHGYKGPQKIAEQKVPFLQSQLTTLPINSADCPWVFL